MIGNLSFEEHVRYFTRMYNHLKSIDQYLDDVTIINTIKSKVMIEQEWENITHNLNIKNIHDTTMVKDFEIWSSKFEAQSEEDDEVRSDEDGNSIARRHNENSEDENSEDENSEDENSEDENSEYEYVITNINHISDQRYDEIPDDY